MCKFQVVSAANRLNYISLINQKKRAAKPSLPINPTSDH